MHKIIYFLIIHILISMNVSAKEPDMAILNNVYSNTAQLFSIGNYSFHCEPYGVITLDSLYNNKSINSSCKKSIENIYKKQPYLRYFTDELLSIKQNYHIEFNDNKCTLYVRGQITLSELLLKEGLVLLEPSFMDKEYIYVYNKAQKQAKVNKKGIWSDRTLAICISEMSKD